LEVEELKVNGIYYAVLLENVAMMICWTVLAIYFGKWWVALLSILCFYSLKHRTGEERDRKEG